jgi:hypothetical protein
VKELLDAHLHALDHLETFLNGSDGVAPEGERCPGLVRVHVGEVIGLAIELL